jgi:hypothetical protein
MPKIPNVMNTTKRLIYGVLSCLLLAAGFARAADRLDPMNNNLSLTSDKAGVNAPAVPCTQPCAIQDLENV